MPFWCCVKWIMTHSLLHASEFCYNKVTEHRVNLPCFEMWVKESEPTYFDWAFDLSKKTEAIIANRFQCSTKMLTLNVHHISILLLLQIFYVCIQKYSDTNGNIINYGVCVFFRTVSKKQKKTFPFRIIGCILVLLISPI